MSYSKTGFVAAAASTYATPSINMPQGTQQRQYTFDTDTQGFSIDTGTLTAVSGRAQISSLGNNSSALEPSAAANVADGETWVDIYNITPDSANQYDVGLLIRCQDANNHYLVAVRQGVTGSASSEFEVYKKVSGTYTSLRGSIPVTTYNTPLALSGTTPTRIMARFVGSQISIYCNETFVLGVVDTTYTTGRVGIRCGGSTGGVVAQFDNLTVYSLPSTWTPSLYTPQSAAAAPQYQIPTAAQINYSEVTFTAAKTITNQAFSLIPLDSIVSDPNGLFSTGTSIYTVPVTGTYAVGLTFRSDAIAGSNVGLAIHTSNADSTNTVWRQDYPGTGNRHTFQYYKVAKFNAGDQLRAIAYVDAGGTTLISGATATFQQVASSAVVAVQPQQAWQAATLGSGYANVATGGYAPAGYYLNSNGNAYLRGLVTIGAVFSVAFTLPAGYRPEFKQQFIVDGYTGSAHVPVTFEVGSSGAVTLVQNTNTATQVDFAQVAFRQFG